MDDNEHNSPSRRHSLHLEPDNESSVSDNRRHSWGSSSQSSGARRKAGKSPIRPQSSSDHISYEAPRVDRTASRRVRSGPGASRKDTTSTSTRLSPYSRRSSISSDSNSEKETGGFFPRLGRILEGIEGGSDHKPSPLKGSKTKGRHSVRSSSSTDSRSTHSKRSSRRSRSSLEKHAEDLAGLIGSNPSLLSVFSTFTSASGASSGSNSTITQKSYDRANVSKKKRTRDRGSRKPEKAVKYAKESSAKEASVPPQGSSDVFQYMQQPSSASNAHLVEMAQATGAISLPNEQSIPAHHWKASMASYPSPPASVHSPQHDDSDGPGIERVHSDSGISVRGSSPDIPDTPLKTTNDNQSNEENSDSEEDESEESEDEDEAPQPAQPLPVTEATRPTIPDPAPYNPDADMYAQRLREQEAERYRHMFHSPSPVPYHMDPRFGPSGALSPRPPAPFVQPQPFQYLEPPSRSYMSPAPLYHPQPGPPPIHGLPHYSQIQQAPPYPPQDTVDRNRTTITGYELVARQLTAAAQGESEPLAPTYRRFEHLNHRVLLHLQDEISELEEDLRLIDETIAQAMPPSIDGGPQPASRRADRYGDNLNYRRTEVLGRIFMKLSQYNQALSSFNSINALGNAEPNDVRRYSTWLEEHTPVEEPEMQFLKDPKDLLSLRNNRATNSQKSSSRTIPTPPDSAPPYKIDHTVALTFALLLVPAFLLPVFISVLLQDFFARAVVLLAIAATEASLISGLGLYDAVSVEVWGICGTVYFAMLACLSAMG